MPIKALSDGTTEIDIKLMDDGRALIHWLAECEDGPIELLGHPVLTHPSRYRERKDHQYGKPITLKYRIACRPEQNSITSQKRGKTRFICMTSYEVAGTTCPACLATKEAKDVLARSVNDDIVTQAVMETIQGVNNGSSFGTPDNRTLRRDVERIAAGNAER